MSALPKYRVYAVRYATRAGRRSEHFLGGDPHNSSMDMDYFVWMIVGDERKFIVDLGFTEETARTRRRNFLRCPIQALASLGADPAEVRDVIITHLHYDHAGNFHRFPNARFHLQEKEMSYATGRHMRPGRLAHGYNVEDVVGMVRLNFAGRLDLYSGDRELAPGVSVHHVGGHTMGIQCVRVFTERGWIVLASDVSHYYENLASGRPFSSAFHVGEMIDGFDRLRALADSDAHIIPGHDPLVMARYSAPDESLRGTVVRVDRVPASF